MGLNMSEVMNISTLRPIKHKLWNREFLHKGYGVKKGVSYFSHPVTERKCYIVVLHLFTVRGPQYKDL